MSSDQTSTQPTATASDATPAATDATEVLIEALTKVEARIREAGQVAARRLNALFNPQTRRYENPEEIAVLHDIINQQGKALNRVRAARRTASGTPGAPGPSIVEDLARAEAAIEEAGQVAARRLNALFNPQTRRYENPEEIAVLHDILNELTRVVYALLSATDMAARTA